MSEQYISEIHRLLKIGGPSEDSHFDATPEALPVHDHMPEIEISHSQVSMAVMPSMNNFTVPKINWKAMAMYPVIFLVAFAFFFLVLNFPSVLSQVQGLFAKPQAQQILGADTAEYYKWISNYFYAVGDPKLMEPANDIDKDGLTNQDEFIMLTNPIIADSDSDGFTDGIELINNANPWGKGSMTSAQKELIGRLDMITINNRISYNVSTAHSSIVPDSVSSNYDLTKPGSLSIPKLKIKVPLIWSKDPADFDVDLTHGVIHYPGSAMPGENGIIYVSGHSSDYIWKRDPMEKIFSKLNFLKTGDDVFIDVYGKDGKVYNFRYQVTISNIYTPDDQAQFFDNSTGSKLNLSTCWPIGTSKDRIVVTAVPVAL